MIYVEFDIWNNVTKIIKDKDTYTQTFIGDTPTSYSDSYGNYWDNELGIKNTNPSIEYEYNDIGLSSYNLHFELERDAAHNIINIKIRYGYAWLYTGTTFRNVAARTIASELVTVQPMGVPIGNLFYLRADTRTSDRITAMGQAMLTRYSEKTINPNFYGTINVDDLIV
tara:strand:- start:21639 stop:22145 length:507 start_codon:yes stop_codon:yes gene_type:complete